MVPDGPQIIFNSLDDTEIIIGCYMTNEKVNILRYGSIIHGLSDQQLFVITDVRPEGFARGNIHAMILENDAVLGPVLTGGQTVLLDKTFVELDRLAPRKMFNAIALGLKKEGKAELSEISLAYIAKAKRKRPIRIIYPS